MGSEVGRAAIANRQEIEGLRRQISGEQAEAFQKAIGKPISKEQLAELTNYEIDKKDEEVLIDLAKLAAKENPANAEKAWGDLIAVMQKYEAKLAEEDRIYGHEVKRPDDRELADLQRYSDGCRSRIDEALGGLKALDPSRVSSWEEQNLKKGGENPDWQTFYAIQERYRHVPKDKAPQTLLALTKLRTSMEQLQDSERRIRFRNEKLDGDVAAAKGERAAAKEKWRAEVGAEVQKLEYEALPMHKKALKWLQDL